MPIPPTETLAKPAGRCRVDVVAVHFVAREVRQETDVVSSGAS